ncbi:thioredoxin family protein [Diaphorobacter sp. HDW4A]|uniref:thioredoxin family protein n=1 Tax=Diaphorobacter sp. HDW4A TaxID=2714924 RepID=UPI0014074828|nr:thioredoxin family protein [Diaphorobacter sp. HDW4A]QIL82706.1 thioredoxin family protein [Diaphorobacter sp. HDW4A]
MSTSSLDPWSDAVTISNILFKTTSKLMVVIGAEAWCEKCQLLKPAFDELAYQAPPHVVMLWLDLEEHVEFLGDYIPETLPELCIYQRGVLVRKVTLNDTEQSLHEALTGAHDAKSPVGEDPGIFARLVRQDWAQSSAR